MVPGTGLTFSGFGDPTLDGDNVGFTGSASGYSALIEEISGTYSIAADTNDLVPNSSLTFDAFVDYEYDQGVFAIDARDTNFDEGIYRLEGGVMTTIADRTTVIPGTSDTFFYFTEVSLDNGVVGFRGKDPFQQVGIYTDSGTGLNTVADTNNTTVPDLGGTFTTFQKLSMNDGVISFSALGTQGNGVYSFESNLLQTVADAQDFVPGTSDLFLFFRDVSTKAGLTAFYGESSLGASGGIYLEDNGQLTTIAELGQSIPNSLGTFNFFSDVMLEEDGVFFHGSGTTSSAIYYWSDGQLNRVIGGGDTLDGKTVNTTLLSTDAVDGNSLAFRVLFTDGSWGIYRSDFSAAVPEPSSLVFLALLAIAGYSRRRTH